MFLKFNQNRLTFNESYAVIAASYQGIVITKVNADYSLTQISSVKIKGSLFSIMLMQNDTYILATTNENPSISLVSIVDIYKPIVIQRIGQESAFGYYSMCMTKDTRQVFITSQFSLLFLQLQNQIILHTQIYELISQENSNEYTRNDLQKGTSLKIGQKIEMHLVPIYQTQDILVRKAFYYEGFILRDLPAWMSFSSSEKILKLDISKDSLQKDEEGSYVETVQQVIFLTYQSVQDYAFLNSKLNINETDSIAIKRACYKEGYMDNLGFIQETYTPSKEITFGVNENIYLAKWVGPKLSLTKQYIQYILNQNIVNYATSFQIAQSISVNLQKKEEHIFSLQSDVIMQMTVLEKISSTETLQTSKAKFVKKNYSGVLMLLSEKQDEIKIEGTLKNINKILQDGVKFSINNELIKPENVLIKILVSDGVNYNYENTVAYNELIFLSAQAPVLVSNSISLQKDLNSKYSEGKIFIQESFQFQVSSDVFTSLDEKTLTYTAKYYDSGIYTDIPKDYWLQFSITDRVFTGTPPASYYNDWVRIQVNATDGYSFTVDEFVLIPNRIPFQYAFQLAIQIFGPIFGVLGFYKYKHFMYNILFKHQYVYSKDVAYVGEVYRKQITITDNNRDAGVKLWEFFFQRIGEIQIMHQLASELMRTNQVTSYHYYSSESKKLDEEQALEEPSFEEEIIKKIYPFGVNTEQLGIVEKKFKKILIESSSKLDIFRLNNGNGNNYMNNSMLNSNNVDSVRDYSPTNKKDTKGVESTSNAYKADVMSQFKNKNALKRKSTVKRVNARKIVDNIRYGLNINDNISRLQHLDGNLQSKKKSKKTIESLQIFLPDGRINFLDVLKYIKEEQNSLPEKKRSVTSDELKQLDNPTSILSYSICCLLVDYIMSQDRVTKNIFDYMYQKSIKYYNEIDWYKAYVDIRPQFEEIHSNPYPIITINQRTARAALVEIFRSLSRYYYDPITRNPKPINFSLNLLEECIKAKAVGFTIKSIPLLQVTQGESLHTFQHLIHSVKAFEKNNDISCCYNIYRKLDLNYIEKGLTDNERLPSWIHSIDLINGTILLSGIPEKKDIGSIIFKIIDEQKFILRSYQVQVLQKDPDYNNPKKPIVISYDGKQGGDSHSNIISALNSQNQTLNVNGNIRTKKVSVFAPTQRESHVDLSQSDINLLPNQQSMTFNNQHFQLTDRLLNQTQNNLMQDNSLPFIFSPNEKNKHIELNHETLDVQEEKNTEMVKAKNVKNNHQDYNNQNPKQQEIHDLKKENFENHNSKQKQSPIQNKHQEPQQNNRYQDSSPDGQKQLVDNQQFFEDNDELMDQEIVDSFVPPSKIMQMPSQDKPNQHTDHQQDQAFQEEDIEFDNLKNTKQISTQRDQNIEQENEIQMSNPQFQSILDSKLRMFQYS